MIVEAIAIVEEVEDHGRKTNILDRIEFKFATGLSLFTDSFLGLKGEAKAKLHNQVTDAVRELSNSGVTVQYRLNGLKAF